MGKSLGTIISHHLLETWSPKKTNFYDAKCVEKSSPTENSLKGALSHTSSNPSRSLTLSSSQFRLYSWCHTKIRLGWAGADRETKDLKTLFSRRGSFAACSWTRPGLLPNVTFCIPCSKFKLSSSFVLKCCLKLNSHVLRWKVHAFTCVVYINCITRNQVIIAKLSFQPRI